LLLGGTAATLTLQQPAGAQVAQNAPGAITEASRGAPMSFADLAAKLQPAVVNVSTTQKVKVSQGISGIPGFPSGTPFDDFLKQFGGDQGAPVTRDATSLGSGFIISPDGYIVTNNHVISGGAEQGEGATAAAPVESITVTLPDRREYKARLVGRDVPSDMALLKIEARNLPFVQWGDSTRARVGDWILAIGNPFALGGTVTAGIISALHRNVQAGQYDRYIQTDAAINQGNSGGPMFDLAGNVIGINTLIFSPTGGNVGIGFAIPAEQARPVIDALMKGGKVHRGYLGVGIQPVTDDIATSLGLPKNHGEIVARVEPNNAAARAGIRQGDVIVKVNNQDVTPDNTLSYIVANLPIGARVPLELIRDGKPMTVTAVVGERPPENQIAGATGYGGGDDNSSPAPGQPPSGQQSARASLGLTLQALTPALAQRLGVPPATRGVVVTAIDQSSDAAQQGVNRGDIILSINQQPTVTTQAAAAAIDAARHAGRPSVLLLVQRGTRPPTYVGVKLQGK
jgi:serine protease Do